MSSTDLVETVERADFRMVHQPAADVTITRRIRQRTRALVDRLFELAETAQDEDVAMKSCIALLDRAYGRPAMSKKPPTLDIQDVPLAEQVKMLRAALAEAERLAAAALPLAPPDPEE